MAEQDSCALCGAERSEEAPLVPSKKHEGIFWCVVELECVRRWNKKAYGQPA